MNSKTTVVACGCARHKRPFHATFVGSALQGVAKTEPSKPSLRDKIKGVTAPSRAVAMRCDELDVAAITCAWCGAETFLCSCGLFSCKGMSNGGICECFCGREGRIVPMPPDATVRGQGADSVLRLGASRPAIEAPRLLLGGRK